MADPIGSVQGISSGIQWRDMVDQIIAAESTPITNLNTRITAAKARETAWSTFKSKLQALSDAAKALADGSKLGGFRTTVMGSSALTASASTGAVAGTYQVSVNRLAAAEKLGGASFASSTAALGIAGEVLINGQSLTVSAADSLTSIAQRINTANSGGTPMGVSAGVVATTSGGYRLVLTSARTGAAGIDLADGANSGSAGGGVLQALGLLDAPAGESIRNPLSNGMKSGAFADSTTAVGTLLKLSSPPLKATLTIGGVSVDVNLATDSLEQIKDAYNARAGTARMSVARDGATGQSYLQYTGPATIAEGPEFGLQLLGFTRATRASSSQAVQGAQLLGGAADENTDLSALGALAGETIAISGTRGDGTAVALNYTVGANDKVSTLLAALNGAFGGGTRPATATISAGKLTLTDGTAGDSLLSLQISARNELGGTLDFGAMTTTAGQTRQITAGADALVTVDGTPVQRSGNTIADAVPGLTLNLSATTSSPATVTVSNDTSGAIAAVKALVDAYNAVADYVTQQTTAPATGAAAPALYGDSTLRAMRTTLNQAMQRTLGAGIAGSFTRLGDLGVTIDKTGRYQVDDAKLGAAVAADPGAIQRLFGLYGAGSTGAISYVSASDASAAGSYALNVTQAARQATLTGSVLAGGTYTATDALNGDLFTVTDLGSGKAYSVRLAQGQALSGIVDALNAEFAAARAQQLGSAVSLQAGGVAATAATKWTDATSGGAAVVATGDVLTISGRRADGSSFATTYTAAPDDTLGSLSAVVQQQLGSDASVSWVNGKLTVTAARTGSSLLSLAISSSNGSSPNPLGVVNVDVEGRSAARITASAVGGALQLDHADYGSRAGFTVKNTGSGLGMGDAGVAQTASGLDVAGTLNGLATTGSGQALTGAKGTAVEGLMLRYAATDTGNVGTLTFSRGIGSAAQLAAAPFLGTEAGSIDALTGRIDDSITGWNSRIDDVQARLDRRREQLIKQFTAMEQALAKSQSQMQWLTTQMNQMSANSSSK